MITGRTRLSVLLGDPVTQAMTPQLVNAELAKRSVDGKMVAVQVTPAGLTEIVRGLRAVGNLCGAVVTMPHKRRVVPLLDAASARVAVSGACNVLKREHDGRLTGDMLDGWAMARAIENAGVPVQDAAVLMLGAGGAAAGIVLELAARGARLIAILNRTPTRAAALAARMAWTAPTTIVVAVDELSKPYDIVINTTPLGVRADDPLLVDPALLGNPALVADAVISTHRTPLLTAATAAGSRLVSGTQMLAAQVGLMVDFIFGAGDEAPEKRRNR